MSAPWSAWPVREPSAGFAAKVAAAARREHAARRRTRARLAGAGALAAAAAVVALVTWRGIAHAPPRAVAASGAAREVDPPPAPIHRDDAERIASRSFAWPTSPDWGGPRFPFPLEFAPSLPYRGGVVTHMAPEFDQRGTPDFWSYVAVWLMEGHPSAEAADLQRDLQTYYSGLCGPSSHPGLYTRVVPRESTVTLAPAPIDPEDRAAGGLSAVRGDVLAPQCSVVGADLRLHVEGVAGRCDDGGSFVAYALSPMPYGDVIWADLRAERRAFACAAR